MDLSIKRTQTPKKYLKWSCIKWTLKWTIYLLSSTTQHARHCKCERLPQITTHKFFDFYIKKVTWRTYLISFTVQECFLFRFVCIALVSLIWFLQIWVASHVYGTMIHWFTLIMKIVQKPIVIVSGSIINASAVHLNGIWHLIWCYISKPVLSGH